MMRCRAPCVCVLPISMQVELHTTLPWNRQTHTQYAAHHSISRWMMTPRLGGAGYGGNKFHCYCGFHGSVGWVWGHQRVRHHPPVAKTPGCHCSKGCAAQGRVCVEGGRLCRPGASAPCRQTRRGMPAMHQKSVSAGYASKECQRWVWPMARPVHPSTPNPPHPHT